METLVDSLTETQRESLRREFGSIEPTGWVIEIAHEKDWSAANTAFLLHERDRGRAEMGHLMAALGVAPPLSPAQAADLVTAALVLFIGPEQTSDTIQRLGPTAVRVRVCDCPTYRRLQATKWLGITACGTWHRRRGWYDALALYPADSVIAESKWGDEACEALIEFAQGAA